MDARHFDGELEAAQFPPGPGMGGVDAAGLAAAKRRVCAIGIDDSHIGTGFLVGPNLVMTCWHVYEAAASAGGGRFFAVFDHDGSTPFVQLPRFEFDPRPRAGSSPGDLDYAILELKSTPSGDRGFFELASYKYQLHEPIQVLGHPGKDEAGRVVAEKLTHTVGSLNDANSATKRLAYTTNTQPGSSGSPVFTESLALIGIHHHGEANTNNHGIPMWAILEDLATDSGKFELVRVWPGSNRPLHLSERSMGDPRLVGLIPDPLRALYRADCQTPGTHVERPIDPEERRRVSLDRYLQDLIEQAGKLPVYFPREAQFANIRVQVRVRLEDEVPGPVRHHPEDAEWRQGAAYWHRHHWDERGRSEKGRTRILDWDAELGDRLVRAVILADPGMGKSWLLKWEARRLALSARSELHRPGNVAGLELPVLVRLEDVGEALAELKKKIKGPVILEEAVVHAMAAQFQASSDLPGLLTTAFREERCVLLLDAWDEAGDYHDVLRYALRDYVERCPKSRLLLTSRIVGQPGPLWRRPFDTAADRELELQPFGPAQQEEFVNNFFANDSEVSLGVCQQLRAAPPIGGLARIPLLLGFLCAYVKDQGKGSATPVLKQLRRDDLYLYITQSLLRGQWHTESRSEAPVPPERQIEEELTVAAGIAFWLHSRRMQQFSREEFRAALRDSYERRLERPHSLQLEEVGLRRFIEESGLISRAGRSIGSKYEFLHVTIQEYLAAQCVAAMKEPERTVAVADHWDNPAWKEVWDFVALQLRGNDRVIEQLVKVILAHGHRLDEHLKRPQIIALRWVILAELEPNERTPACAEVLRWACPAVEHAKGIDAQMVMSELSCAYGRLPAELERTLCTLLEKPADPVYLFKWTSLKAGVPHVTGNTDFARLLETLGLTSSSARQSEPMAMGQNTRSEEIQALLLKGLAPLNEPDKQSAIISLGNCCDSEPVRSLLVRIIEEESDTPTRLAAIRALSHCAESEPNCSALLACLQDPSERVRTTAIRALRTVTGKEPIRSRLIRGLRDGLRDTSANVRVSCVDALATFATSEAIRCELSGMLEDPDFTVRHAAVGALGPYAASDPFQSRLLTLLSDSDWFVRTELVSVLTPYAGTEPLQSRLFARLNDRSAFVRWFAVTALGLHCSYESLQSSLLARLADRNADVRAAAVLSLGPCASSDPVQSALMKRLADWDSLVRKSAVKALARYCRSEEIRPRLLKRIKDWSAVVREAATEALQPLADDEAVRPVLLKRLGDWNGAVRAAAIRTLSIRGGSESVRCRLLECLNDRTPFVRIEAVNAVGLHCGSGEVEMRLRQCLFDCDRDVRAAAWRALEAVAVRERHGRESESAAGE